MSKTLILTGKQAKFIDDYTQSKGTNGELLMDRAAEAMKEYIVKHYDVNTKVACVAGIGNNGGDVIVLSNKLVACGYASEVIRVNKETNVKDIDLSAYDLIVDGIFGIGLSRNVEGSFKELIDKINSLENVEVLACDIPSGINANDATVMGTAIKANVTITFGYNKLGMCVYPGKDYSGEVIVCDIGFDEGAFAEAEMQNIAFTNCHDLPKRVDYSNKGSYGKVLVIAGSENMPGAAMLASKAALRYGAGYSTLHAEQSVLDKVVVAVPEVVLSKAFEGEEYVEPAYDKADAIIIGPGLGKSEIAKCKVNATLKASQNNAISGALIVDADAINLISEKMDYENIVDTADRIEWLSKHLPEKTIYTPHKKELSRLLNVPMTELASLVAIAKKLQLSNQIFVLKDASTIVASKDYMYINNSGNNGMSTPGVGDVLTGAIAAFIAQKMEAKDAVASAVYYHGLAGDEAEKIYSKYGVMASDLCDMAAIALKNIDL